MTLEILGVGLGAAEQVSALQAQPAFRKATRNMALAYAAAQGALLGSLRERLGEGEAMGLVLGTCFGELDTTREFLDGFYESGLARPVLFQNSLHNATTGFLAIQLRVTGPSFTVSRGVSSGLAALELGYQALSSGLCTACLVLSVEARVAELEPLFQAPGAVDDVQSLRRSNEGAACLLLGLRGAGGEHGIDPCAWLEQSEVIAEAHSLRIEHALPGINAQFEAPLAACPVFHLASQISDKEKSKGEVVLAGASRVSWRRT